MGFSDMFSKYKKNARKNLQQFVYPPGTYTVQPNVQNQAYYTPAYVNQGFGPQPTQPSQLTPVYNNGNMAQYGSGHSLHNQPRDSVHSTHSYRSYAPQTIQPYNNMNTEQYGSAHSLTHNNMNIGQYGSSYGLSYNNMNTGQYGSAHSLTHNNMNMGQYGSSHSLSHPNRGRRDSAHSTHSFNANRFDQANYGDNISVSSAPTRDSIYVQNYQDFARNIQPHQQFTVDQNTGEMKNVDGSRFSRTYSTRSNGRVPRREFDFYPTPINREPDTVMVQGEVVYDSGYA